MDACTAGGKTDRVREQHRRRAAVEIANRLPLDEVEGRAVLELAMKVYTEFLVVPEPEASTAPARLSIVRSA